mmetsp:Transcript_108028/g.301880  ORF Transcript_108028/g.301880 Transcript_108028/m.301880 type:complete len:261 (+) Transcript_108028:3-785(+)
MTTFTEIGIIFLRWSHTAYMCADVTSRQRGILALRGVSDESRPLLFYSVAMPNSDSPLLQSRPFRLARSPGRTLRSIRSCDHALLIGLGPLVELYDPARDLDGRLGDGEGSGRREAAHPCGVHHLEHLPREEWVEAGARLRLVDDDVGEIKHGQRCRDQTVDDHVGGVLPLDPRALKGRAEGALHVVAQRAQVAAQHADREDDKVLLPSAVVRADRPEQQPEHGRRPVQPRGNNSEVLGPRCMPIHVEQAGAHRLEPRVP